MKKEDINFGLAYIQVGVPDGQINLLLAKINIYRKKLSLPLAIKCLLMPIFRDLSNETLLEKCLHDYPQNDNEAINSVVWKKCRKHVFVSNWEFLLHQLLLSLMMVVMD